MISLLNELLIERKKNKHKSFKSWVISICIKLARIQRARKTRLLENTFVFIYKILQKSYLRSKTEVSACLYPRFSDQQLTVIIIIMKKNEISYSGNEHDLKKKHFKHFTTQFKSLYLGVGSNSLIFREINRMLGQPPIRITIFFTKTWKICDPNIPARPLSYVTTCTIHYNCIYNFSMKRVHTLVSVFV